VTTFLVVLFRKSNDDEDIDYDHDDDGRHLNKIKMSYWTENKVNIFGLKNIK
jgi:hypothetical protein